MQYLTRLIFQKNKQFSIENIDEEITSFAAFFPIDVA